MPVAALRCLVIEDDPVAGGVLRQMLKKFGPCTLAASVSFEADGYLLKPVSAELLQAKIAELLELRSCPV